MNLNAITADMSFIGSSIAKLNVSNNIKNLVDTNCTFGVDVDITNIQQLSEQQSQLRGYVLLKVTVNVKGIKQKSAKSKIVLELEGCFETSTLDKDHFAQMLFLNGGSTLYSIARGIIGNLSTQTYQHGKILLPMINMVQLLKEKVNAIQEAQEKKAATDSPKGKK